MNIFNRNSNPEGRCIHCGSKIRYKAPFCFACGKSNVGWRKPDKTQCGNCHAGLREGDRYCQICGTKVGMGKYAPYQDLMECIYGPMPVEREHTCKVCGNSWTTFVMVDKAKYCPMCGGRLSTNTLNNTMN